MGRVPGPRTVIPAVQELAELQEHSLCGEVDRPLASPGSQDTDTQIETHVCTHTHTYTLKHTDTGTDRKGWLQKGAEVRA